MSEHEAPNTPQVLEESTEPPTSTSDALDAQAEARMRAMSRRSFLWAGIAAASTLGGVRWLNTRRTEDGIPWPLRRTLQVNEEIARDLSRPYRLAPTFASTRIDPPRANGDIGLGDFNLAEWELAVEGLAGDEPMKSVTLAQIKALPRVEMITELKCIEGWAIVQKWAGARLSDFMAKFPPATPSGEPFSLQRPDDAPGFVGMATPDGAYYVGIEREAALHPQTLLCYEMNGKPLTPEHGAPLRLAIPVKYGIKSIKRIGTISFTNQRPADYWHEQGYDYHAGH
jgi:hypothetical protein